LTKNGIDTGQKQPYFGKKNYILISLFGDPQVKR